MDAMKSKSIRNIETKMETVEPGSVRYQALECAKNFKSSWIALGQILYTVYKDKHFKSWGYITFEAYCKGEIGIHQNTASKLLHSYYFLEKKEPQFLRSVNSGQDEPSPKKIPDLDAVNVLRLAANRKEFSEEDYNDFKKSVFEDGREGRDVRKQVGLKLRSIREEEDPQKARQERRTNTLRRLIATVKTLQKELTHGHLISEKTSKELEKVLEYLNKEIILD